MIITFGQRFQAETKFKQNGVPIARNRMPGLTPASVEKRFASVVSEM